MLRPVDRAAGGRGSREAAAGSTSRKGNHQDSAAPPRSQTVAGKEPIADRHFTFPTRPFGVSVRAGSLPGAHSISGSRDHPSGDGHTWKVAQSGGHRPRFSSPLQNENPRDF